MHVEGGNTGLLPRSGPDNVAGPYSATGTQERPVDWRWREAATQLEVNGGSARWHPDPWVAGALIVMADVVRRAEDPPSPIHLAIGDAQAIYHSDSLRKQILEARLIADVPLSDIAAGCEVAELVIQAYEALFFDMAAPHGRWWQGGASLDGLSVKPTGATNFGWALKVIASQYGAKGLQEAIDTLFAVDGRSLAADITLEDVLEETDLFAARFKIASKVRPHTKRMAKASGRYLDSIGRAFTKTDKAEREFNLLAAATIPPPLGREIAEMRKERDRMRQTSVNHEE